MHFADAKSWDAWLATNHASQEGADLRLSKKGASVASVTYAEAVEVALVWGWIDGPKRGLDDEAWIQRFTPRRSRSPWSKINRTKAESLIRDGKMKPPGLAEVERARRDGRWEAAYDSARSATIPDDLAAAFAKNRKAAAFFGTIDGANRYAVLYRVTTAKKPETRARRIAQLVDMLARHETIHPRRGGARETKSAGD